MKKVLLSIFSVFLAHFLLAQVKVFNGVGSWNTGARWTGSIAPNGTQDALIPAGTTVTGFFTSSGECRNLTVNGVLLINTSPTLRVFGSITGTGRIEIATGSTLSIFGDNFHSGPINNNTGIVAYSGGNQRLRATTYNQLIVGGTGVKTLTGSLSNFTLTEARLTIHSGSELHIRNTGFGSPTITCSGSGVRIEGILRLTSSFATNLGFYIDNATLNGGGEVYIGEIGKAHKLFIDASVGFGGELYSNPTAEVHYLSNTPQNVFSSPNYPRLFFKRLGLKTAVGPITCTAFNLEEGQFSLGTQGTASSDNYNLLVNGVADISPSTTLLSGITNAKRIDFAGNFTCLGVFSMSGVGLQNYVRFGGANVVWGVNSLGIGVPASNWTAEFYRLGNQTIYTNSIVRYYNLVVSGSLFSHRKTFDASSFSDFNYIYGNLSVSGGALVLPSGSSYFFGSGTNGLHLSNGAYWETNRISGSVDNGWSSFENIFFSDNSNVNYYGAGDQIIATGSSLFYGNLNFGVSGTRIVGNQLNVKGNLISAINNRFFLGNSSSIIAPHQINGNASISNVLSFTGSQQTTLQVAGNLTMGTGSFLDMSKGSLPHVLRLGGAFNTVTSFSGANETILMYGTVDQEIPFTSAETIYNLNIAGGSIKDMKAALNIANGINLGGGKLQMNNFGLTLLATVPSITGTTFSNTNLIVYNGTGRLGWQFGMSVAGTKFYPIGLPTTPGNFQYLPAELRYTNISTSFSGNRIYISPFSGNHPNLRDDAVAAKNFWRIQPTLINSFSGTVLGFNSTASNFSNLYSGGFYSSGVWNTVNGSFGSPNFVAYRFSAANSTVLTGDLTAAPPGSFNSIISFPSNASPLSVCANQVVSIPISAAGTAFSGNNFVEFSTAAGLWLNPMVVRTFTGTASPVLVTIPSTLPSADYYVRIRTSNLVYISDNSSYQISVKVTPTNTTSNLQMCADGTSIKNLVGANGTNWVVVPSTVGGISGNTFTAASILGVGFQTATLYNVISGGCSSPGVSFQLYNKPRPLNNTSAVCINQLKNLTPNDGAPWFIFSGQGSISGDNFISTVAGIKTVYKQTAAGCVSDNVNFMVNPNTAITNQPDDLTVGQGSEAVFDVTAIGGAPILYQWRRNGTNVVNSVSVSGVNSSVLSISGVPLSLNNSLITVSVTSGCGTPVISNVVTLTVVTIPAATFRSNIAAGNWNNPANWQVWNGTTWVATTFYPGQIVTGDNVSITGGHIMHFSPTMTANALGGMTVSGLLSLTGGSLRFREPVINNGSINNVGAGASLQFNKVFTNNGTFAGISTATAGTTEFRNGFVNNTPISIGFVVENKTLFANNSQTISGSALYTSFYGNVEIQDGLNILNASTTVEFSKTLTGLGATSTWEIGSLGRVRAFSNTLLMPIGNFKADNVGATVIYYGNNVKIKNTPHFRLESQISGVKHLDGSVACQQIVIENGSTLSFSGTNQSVLSIAGIFNYNGNIDMSGGALPHQMYISANAISTGTGINLVKGNGSVFYNAATAQNIFNLNYNNLIIDNPSTKTLIGNITVSGLTITGNSTLSTQQHSITGGAGIMQMDAGATLELGSTTNTTPVPFPPGLSTNFHPNSTVVYQSLGNQTVDGGVPNYGNLVIAGAGVKNSTGDFQVTGNLSVNAGATFQPNSAILLSGNLSNNGNYISQSLHNLVFSGAANQLIDGTQSIQVQKLGMWKSSGEVDFNNNVFVNNEVVFISDGYFNLNGYNLSISGLTSFTGFDSFKSIFSNGNYSAGSVVLLGSTSGQYLNKVIPFSTPIGYSPVTVIGLTGTFNTSSNIELKPIVTITGNSGRYARPGLYAKTNNIIAPVNFKFGMDMADITASPKSVYYYNPTRTTITGSFVDEPNNNFGVGGNSIFTNINGTYIAEGEYFEPSIYRTIANGNWSTLANWERFNGVSWLPATTLPGMAVAGDQVLVSPTYTLSLDLNPSYSIQSLTVAGGAALSFGTTKRVLTISGDLISQGTGPILNMENAAHDLYIGGASIFFNTNGLVTNAFGSTIYYYNSNGQIFSSNNYERLVVKGGVRSVVLPSIFKANYLEIENGAQFDINLNGFNGNINGITNVNGILGVSNANSSLCQMAFSDDVQIGANGSLILSNSSSGILNTYFLGDLVNDNAIFSSAPTGALNVFFQGGGSSVVANSLINFGAARVAFEDNVSLEGADGFVFNRPVTVSADKIVDNFSHVRLGTLTGANTGSTWNNNTGSTFIYNCDAAGYIPPMTIAGTANTGKMVASFTGNNFLYSISGANGIINNNCISYFNLSFIGASNTNLYLNSNTDILNNLYVFNSGIIPNTNGVVFNIFGDFNAELNGRINLTNTTNNLARIFGNINTNGTPALYVNQASNSFEFASSSPQNINSKIQIFNGSLIVSGGGDKVLYQNLDNFGTQGILSMAGANIVLNGHTVAGWSSNSPFGNRFIKPFQPFGVGNMIVFSGLGVSSELFGFISNTFNGLIGAVYPFGIGAEYFPFKIDSYSGVGGLPTICARPFNFSDPTITDNYLNKGLYIENKFTNAGDYTNIQFSFNFPSSSVIGNPLNVYTSTSIALVQDKLPNTVISTTSINTTTTVLHLPTSSSAYVRAYNIPNVLYVSTASGSWNDNTIWKKSVDNGVSFQPLSGGSYPGSTILENYDVKVEHNIDGVSSLTKMPDNLTISGNSKLIAYDDLYINNNLILENGILSVVGTTYTLALNNAKVSLNSRIEALLGNTVTLSSLLDNQGVVNIFDELRIGNTRVVSITGNGLTKINTGASLNINSFPNITITNFSTNLQIDGTIQSNATSRLINETGGYIKYNNGSIISNTVLITSISGNTFEYGGNPTQYISSVKYYNLVLKNGAPNTKQILGSFEVLNNLTVDGVLNFPNDGDNCTIFGSVFGSGAINMSALNNKLHIGGDFLHTGTMDTPFDSEVHYFGTNEQFVKPYNYGSLRVSGGSRKYLTGNVSVGTYTNASNLFLQGGILDIGNHSVTLLGTSSISTLIPLGVNNMVLTTGTGYVVISRNSDINLLSFPMPIGVNNSAMPVSLNGSFINSGTFPSELKLKGIEGFAPNLLSTTLVWPKYWQIATQNIDEASSTGNFSFGYLPADLPAAESALKGSFYNAPSWTPPDTLNASNDRYYKTFSSALFSGNYAIGPRSAFADGYIYVSTATGSWNSNTTWYVSINNGATYAPATDYPGQTEAGDKVIVNHPITATTITPDILPLGGLTLSGNGNLTVNDETLVIGGKTLISCAIAGNGFFNNGTSKATFIGNVDVVNGKLESPAVGGFMEFQNGMLLGSGAAVSINSPLLFSTNNQTISGIQNVNIGAGATISGVNVVLSTPGFTTQVYPSGYLIGTNTASILEISEYTRLRTLSNSSLQHLMQNGILLATATGALVGYGASANQLIYPTDYYYLDLYGSGVKSVTSSINTNELYLTNSTLKLSGTNNQIYTYSTFMPFNAIVDMSASGGSSRFQLNGPVSGVYSLIPGTGIVAYGSNGVQSVIGTNYYNLELSGGDTKLQNGNLTVNGTMLLDGAVLKTSGNNVVLGNAAQIEQGVVNVFSSSNFIDFDKPTGVLTKYAPNGTGFAITYPIGSGGVYAPAYVADFQGTSFINPKMDLRTDISSQAFGQQYSQRYFSLSLSGFGSLISFRPVFNFDSPSELIGAPSGMYVLNGSDAISLTGTSSTLVGNGFYAPNAGDIKPNGKWVLANLNEGNLFRSKNSGDWSNLANWEVSYDNGTTFTDPVYLPGFGTGPDNVLISTFNTINNDVTLNVPVKSLTVSGFLSPDPNPLTISGATLITGQINTTAPGSALFFNDVVSIVGSFARIFNSTFPESDYYFRNGVVMQGANAQINLGNYGRMHFSTNNQTVTGGTIVCGNNMLIDNVSVDFDCNVAGFIVGTLNGTSSSSIFKLAPNRNFNYFNSVMPMIQGALDVDAIGSFVTYNGSGQQNIAPVDYYNLTITGGGANIKTLSGITRVFGNFENNSNTFIADGASIEIYNNILGTGGISFSSSSPSNLKIGGDYINTGGLNTGISTIEYNGSFPQIMKSTQYYNLVVSGNSEKTPSFSTISGLSIVNDLNLNGGIIHLANDVLDLRPGAGMTEGQTFGPLNMIRCPDDHIIGTCLVRSGSVAGHYLNFVYPIGNSSGYSPVTISGISGTFAGNSFLFLKPVTTVNSSPNYVTRGFRVFSQGLNLSDFKPTFSYNAPEQIGMPTNVNIYTGAPIPYEVPGGFVDTVTGTFGIASGTNTSVNGFWMAVDPVYPPALFRSTTSGNWGVNTNWEMSSDGGATWTVPGWYPGLFSSKDMVSITGGNTISLDVNPKPIDGLTVSGVLELGSSNFVNNGITLIESIGTLQDNNTIGSTNLYNDLIVIGQSSLGNSSTILRSNIIFNTSLSTQNLGNLTFSGLNRSITGTSTSNSPSFGNITIDNNSHLKFAIFTGWLSRLSNINGLGTNSVFELGTNGFIEYTGGLKPMATGILIASNTYSQFSYSNTSIQQNQFIKGGKYDNLGIGDSFQNSIKYIDEDIEAESFSFQGSKLVFSSTSGINFIVNSRTDANQYLAEIDLSILNQAHNVTFSGSFEIGANASILGSNHPNSKVVYNNTFNNGFGREVLKGVYNNLIIDGPLIRDLDGNISAANLSITGGATLDSKQYQITGTPAGNMFMESGTKLILGDINVNSISGPLFPTLFTKPNINIQSGVTVSYQQLANQTVSGIPDYWNLEIAGGGTVKELSGNTNIRGDLLVRSGHLDMGQNGAVLSVLGVTSVDGVIQHPSFPLSAPSTFAIFEGDVYINNQYNLQGGSSNPTAHSVRFNNQLLVGSTGVLRFRDYGQHSVTVLGSLSCAGIIDMNAATASFYLNLFGPNNNVANYIGNSNLANVRYLGVGNQEVFGANYGVLVLNGGAKSLTENASVNSVLSLNGAVFNIQNNNLTLEPNAVITGTVGYSPTNMIEVTTTPGAGFLIKEFTNGSGFSTSIYPIGTQGVYSPVSVIGISSISPLVGSLGVRPIVSALGVSDFISRGYELKSIGFPLPVALTSQMAYDEPAERIGIPEQVWKYTNGIGTTLSGGFVNTSTGVFGYSANNSLTTLDGVYFAQSNIIPSVTGAVFTVPSICAGGAYNLHYTTVGRFNIANTFTVDISNSPSFVFFETIGNVTSNTPTGFVNITIPGTYGAGSYFVRIRSSLPASSFAMPSVVRVLAVPSVSSVTPTKGFTGNTINFLGSNLTGVFTGSISGNVFLTPFTNTNASFISTTISGTSWGNIDNIVLQNQCGIHTVTSEVFNMLGPDFASMSVSPNPGFINTSGVVLTFTSNIINISNQTVSGWPADVQWTLSNASIASITVLGGNRVLLSPLDNGVVTLTATSVHKPSLSVNVPVNITGQSILKTLLTVPSSICAGTAITIPFSSQNVASPGSYIAQLSDASGSFASPVILGSVTTVSPINAILPLTLTGGVAYRIRVVKGSFIGSDNGIDIIINSVPKLQLPVAPLAGTICENTTGTIRIQNSETDKVYNVIKSDGFNAIPIPIAGNGGNLDISLAATAFAVGNNVFTIRSISASCGSGDMAIQPQIRMVRNPDISKNVTATPQGVCAATPFSVNVVAAEQGVVYTLFNQANSNQIGTALTGTGANLSFNLNSSSFSTGQQNFLVRAITPACGQSFDLLTTTSVDIVALPEVNPVTAAAVCSGSASVISLTGSPASVELSWIPGNPTGTVVLPAAGTGNVISAIANGVGTFQYAVTPRLGTCQGSVYRFTVTVTALPVTNLTVSSDSICGNSSAQIRIRNAEPNVNYATFSNGVQYNSTFTDTIAILVIAPAAFGQGSNTILITALGPGCVPQPMQNNANVFVLSQVNPPSIIQNRTEGAACDKLNITLNVDAGFFDYQWRRNGVAIVEANSNSYEPVLDGSYTVDVFSTRRCFATTASNAVTLTNTTPKPVITGYGSPNDTLLEAPQASTYQWYTGRKAIVGETSRQYKPLYRAAYRVKINPNDPCGQMSDEYVVSNLRFDLLTRQNFEQTDTSILIKPLRVSPSTVEVFPNPAKDKFTLVFEKGSENYTALLRMYNSQGLEVYKQTAYDQNGTLRKEISVAELPTGIYRILITIGEEQFVGKIAVE